MGNTIKNYERKKRREQKQVYREVRQIVHDIVSLRMDLPDDIIEKEREIFNFVNNKY